MVSGQGDGSRLIADDGTPVRPAIVWQDNRSAALITDWQNEGRAQQVTQYTRSVLCGSHQTAQLAWLQQHEPEALSRTWKVFFAKDWVMFRLTGLVATDQSDAGHTYLDAATRQLEPRILEMLGLDHLRSRLPPVLDAGQNTAQLRPDIAAEVGLPTGLPVVGAPLDLVCDLLGVGGFAAGVACSVFGTAGVHQVVIDSLPDSPVETGYTTCLPGKPLWVRFIPTMLAMPNIDYWASLLYGDATASSENYDSWTLIEERLQAIPAGAEGVIYLPFLSPAGERAPRMRPQAKAQFLGMSLLHDRDHLMRAVYEGLAIAAADSFGHLPPMTRGLRLAGGGAHSELLAQILADVLGQPVWAFTNTGARGAALFAAQALGLFSSYEAAYQAMSVGFRICEANPSNAETYRTLFNRYRELVYGPER